MKKFFLSLALILMVMGCALAAEIPEEPIGLSLGVETEVTIGEYETICFRFTPEETDEYVFYAVAGWPSITVYEEKNGSRERYTYVGNHFELKMDHIYIFEVINHDSEQTYRLIIEKYLGLLYARRDNEDPEIYVDLDERASLHVDAAVNAGSISYTWYINDWVRIDNANEATYITDEITYYAKYICRISDDFGHVDYVYFYVYVDNELTILGNGWNRVTASPEEQITLSVSATRKTGKLTYQWYEDGNLLEEISVSTYTTESLVRNTLYRCDVSDRFGNQKSVYFDIALDNDLEAEAANKGLYLIAPGDTPTIEVIASAHIGSIAYEWYKEGALIEGAQDASYMTGEVFKTTEFSCIVRDEYGSEKSVAIIVQIDTGLKVERVGASHQIWVSPGENATLQVNATIYWGQILYQWYDNLGEIEGATGSSYVVQNANGIRNLRCEVEDRYGNQYTIDYEVRVDNELRFDTDEDVKVFVQQGDDVQLRVNATCYKGAMTYQWVGSGFNGLNINVMGQDSSLLLQNIQGVATVYCYVQDEYGNRISKKYDILVENGFTVIPKGDLTRTVSFNECVLLEVEASCDVGVLTYKWQNLYGPEEFSATESILTPAIKKDSYYACYVTDQYGNQEAILFSLLLEKETEGSLSARAIGDTRRYVEQGSNVTLAVEVTEQEGDVSYIWAWGYHVPSDRYIRPICQTSQYTIKNIQNSTWLTCFISDQSGKTIYIRYAIIVVDKIKPLQLNVLTDAEQKDESYVEVFSFIPNQSGTYAIEIRDPQRAALTLSMYEVDGQNSISINYIRNTNLHSIEMILKEGVEYQIQLNNGYYNQLWTFRLILKAVAEENRSVLLQTGQSIRIPVPASAGNLVEITGGDASVLTASGDNIQANAAGTASVSFVYDNRKINYTVRVIPAEAGIKYPSMLTMIGEEAFYGDQNLKFVQVDESVSNIGSQAFAASGLLQIIIGGIQTEIASDAFGTLSPQILCVPGSNAEKHAVQYGYDYVYIP